MNTKTMLRGLAISASLLVLVGAAAPAVAVADPRDETKECKPLDKPGNDDKKRCPPPSSGGAARADYNGDGFSDLAMGAPGEDVGNVVNAGAVIVAYGSADGVKTAGSRLLHPGLSPIPGPPVQDQQFGSSLAGGDFNLDGYADLAVTATYPAARLYVLYGSFNGLGGSAPMVWTPNDLGLADSSWSLVWGNFGRGAEADLAIGGRTPPRPTTLNQDRVTVLFGSTAGGLGAKGTQVIDAKTLPSWDEDTGARFGKVLAAGNLGLSEEDELVVGAPGRHDGAGKVVVLYGSSNGVDSYHELSGGNEVVDSHWKDGRPAFGSALAISDFDGDGVGDLAVGAPYSNHTNDPTSFDEGEVFVFRGSKLRGVSTAVSQTLSQVRPEPEDHFGWALAAGDFDGDGKRDLAIGAPLEDLTAAENNGTAADDAGAVTVTFGSSSGLTTGRQFLVQGRDGLFGTAETGDGFGITLSAWNWGRGSATDLAVGVPWEDVGTQWDSGVVQVLYGSTGGAGFGGQQLLDQSHFGLSVEAGDQFGRALY